MNTFSTLLIFLLITVVGVQSWHMIKMENHLNTLQTQKPVNKTADIDQPSNYLPQQYNPTYVQGKEQISQERTQLSNQTLPPYAYMAPNHPPYYAPPRPPYNNYQRIPPRMERRYDSSRSQNTSRYKYHFNKHLSSPDININEDNNEYRVTVSIPGTDEDSISVNLDGRRLTIRAKQGYKKETSDPEGHFIIRERSSGSFQRSLVLNEPVDERGMKTRVDNGVLKIIIPKVIR